MRILITFLLSLLIIIPSGAKQIFGISPDKIKVVSEFGMLWGAVKFRSNAPHELIDRKGSEYVQILLDNNVNNAAEKIFIQFLNEFDKYVRKESGYCECVKFDRIEKYGQKVVVKLEELICGKSRDRIDFREGAIPQAVQFSYKNHRFNSEQPHLNLMPLFFLLERR